MKKIYFAGLVAVLIAIGVFLFVSFLQDVGERITGRRDTSLSPQAFGETVPETLSSPSVPEAKFVEGRSVEILPKQQQMVRMKTVAAAIRPIQKTLKTVGRVELDETKVTTVNIKVEGWIEKLHADYTGKYVKQGTPLAEIYSPELMSLQLEYINLLNLKSSIGFRYQRNIEFSWGDRYGTVGRVTTTDLEGLFIVAKQKFSLWEIPEEEIKEIEKTMRPIRVLTIKSPASGFVFQKPAFKGTRVTPGDKIFDIVDLSTVWVIADIYEYEMPFVKVGQSAKITLSCYPEKEFHSKVDFVYPSLSGQTRTARARFVIPNPGALLKPQMFANVEMQINLGARLAIPETAVLDTGTRQIVYVDQGDGNFAPRQIKPGVRGSGMVEVINGVKPGERVASSAVFLIDSESKLKGETP